MTAPRMVCVHQMDANALKDIVVHHAIKLVVSGTAQHMVPACITPGAYAIKDMLD